MVLVSLTEHLNVGGTPHPDFTKCLPPLLFLSQNVAAALSFFCLQVSPAEALFISHHQMSSIDCGGFLYGLGHHNSLGSGVLLS